MNSTGSKAGMTDRSKLLATDLTPEIVHRMAALVFMMAEADKADVAIMGTGQRLAYNEAHAIAALLRPVSVDVLAARQLASSFSQRNDVGARDFLSGDLDSSYEVQGFLEAVRRGRAIEAGERK